MTVLSLHAQSDRTGGYLLIIEPVAADKQIFPAAMKAHMALAEWSGKDVRENFRYFALGEDGIPMECDAERWKVDSPHRRGIEIPCSHKSRR